MPSVVIADSVSSIVVPEDYYRILLLVSNSSSTANLHIGFGVAATTSDAYIAPGGNMTIGDSRCKCAIYGISSSGDITAKFSKLGSGT